MKTRISKLYRHNLYSSSSVFIRWLFKVVILFSTAVALGIKPTVASFSEELPGLVRFVSILRQELGAVSLAHVLAVILEYILIERMLFRSDKAFDRDAFVLSCVFSVFMLVGFSFAGFHGFDFITANFPQFIISLIVFCGYLSICYPALKLFFEKTDTLRLPILKSTDHLQWIDKHLMLVCPLTIAVCWTVLWIWFFPGNVPYDGQNQLNMYFGVTQITNHHPYYSTLVMGFLIDLGRQLLGNDYGIFLYVLIQYSLGILVYSSVCIYMRKKGLPLTTVMFAVSFYALIPMFGSYSIAVLKDSLYLISFTWYCLNYTKRLLDGGARGRFISLVISAILVCLLRSNGIYIVVPSLFVLCFLVDRGKKNTILAVVVVLFLHLFLNSFVLNKLGVLQGSIKEIMSVPFQITARYVKNHDDELTDTEKAIIDKILPYDELADNYDPELADPIKDRYRRNSTQDNWHDYISLLFRLCLKHPTTCAEAVINHMFGYLDPFYFRTSEWKQLVNYTFGHITNSPNEQLYAFYTWPLMPFRKCVTDYSMTWIQLPILSFFMCPSAYSWTIILMSTCLLRKKQYKKLAVLTIPTLNLLICFVSPVNSYMRYMMPVASSFPVYLISVLLSYMRKPSDYA